MGMVEVDDQRTPVVVPSIVAGLVAFGIIAFMGGNVFTLFLVPAAIAVLFAGKTMERQGADRTVVIQQRERTPKVLKTAAYIMVASAAFSLLSLQFGWMFMSLLAGAGLWALAHHRAGGRWPWEDEDAEVVREVTPEDRALGNTGDHIFRKTGMFTKSASTGLELYPDVVDVGLDEKGRPYFEFRVISGKQTIEDVRMKEANIASAWDVPRVVVSEPSPHVARCTAIMRESMVPGMIEWKPVPANVSVVEYCAALPMGFDVEEGDEWTLDIRGKHFVVAGETESGKSSFVNGVLGHLSRHPHIRIAYLDLKFGNEAKPWKDRADTILFNRPRTKDPEQRSVDEIIDFMEAVMDDVGERYERMAERNVQDAWTQNFLGEDEPVKILVVDETSRLFKLSGSTNKQKKAAADRASRAEDALQELAEECRAAGYLLITMTQHPTSKNLPMEVRINAAWRIAFKCGATSMGAILGDNYSPKSALTDPTKIPAEKRGRAVLVDKKGNQRCIQMVYLDREKKQKIASSCARLKSDQWLGPEAQRVFEAKVAERQSASDDEPPRAARSSDSVDAAVDAELEELLKGMDLD